VIAHFGEATGITARPLPDQATQQLADLVARRRQIVEMIGSERQREKRANPRIKKSIGRLVKALERELSSVDTDIDDAVRGSPAWREKEDLLSSVPSIGPVISRTLIAELPELGTLDRKQIAAGDGPNSGTFLDRADSPGATNRFLRRRAPEPDMCPGETAATDAQWGDRAFERQYRDRMRLRWLECTRARSIAPSQGGPIRGECMMHEERRLFVGIDWASQEHVVTLCDGDGDGEKIGERNFVHGGTGLSDMISWLAESEWRRAQRDSCRHRDTAWSNCRSLTRARLQRLFHQPKATRSFP